MNKNVALLVAAAKDAIDDDGGFAHENGTDYVGYRACCFLPASESHSDDCWIEKLKAAITLVESEECS